MIDSLCVDTLFITTPPSANVSLVPDYVNSDETLSCFGDASTGIEVIASGGTGPNTYQYYIPLYFPVPQNTNVFVGLFNLIPLLPLDGGHIAVAVYERIRSRKGIRYHADASKLLPLTYAVVFALIFIGIAAVYLDIADPISL